MVLKEKEIIVYVAIENRTPRVSKAVQHPKYNQLGVAFSMKSPGHEACRL